MTEPYLTTEEAAALADVSIPTIAYWRKKGYVRIKPIGRMMKLVNRADVLHCAKNKGPGGRPRKSKPA